MSAKDVRYATWNPGPRSSHAAAKIKWIVRRARAVKVLLSCKGGPPSVIALQETTADMQRYFVEQLAKAGYKYFSYGNGMNGHPKDRSGDNVVVLLLTHVLVNGKWVVADWEVTATRQGYAYTPDLDYFVAVQARRVGTQKKRWFVSSHPTSGGSKRKNRIGQVDGQGKVMERLGVDLERTIWGMDSNDTAPSTSAGVRQELRQIGLRDALELKPTAIGDTAHGFGRDKYIPKLGTIPLDLVAVNPAQCSVRYIEVNTTDPKAGDHYMVIVGLTLL